VALVSDAGTPAISDPGVRAVATVRANGFAVIPIPGPNAAIAALSVAGIAVSQFFFGGFLPVRRTARRHGIEAVRDVPAPLVFYEAPHRIAATLSDLASVLEPSRELVVARELTKVFEEIATMPLSEGPAWIAGDINRQRGEFVVIVSGSPQPRELSTDAQRTLKLLLGHLPLKQAVSLAVEITGAPRNTLYNLALEQKNQAL
jgi:16S rRNA (cytidine1402-2'-O)-methyltransferase